MKDLKLIVVVALWIGAGYVATLESSGDLYRLWMLAVGFRLGYWLGKESAVK